MEHYLEELADNPLSVYIAGGVILLSLLYYLIKTRGIPPGPIGVPYLGLFPFLNHDTCHLQLREYAKKYGDVFSFTYTGRLYIHLGSVKTTKEAHLSKSDCFCERPVSYSLLYDFVKEGVVYMKGEPWKMVRKFFLMQFKERGMNTIKESLSGPMYDTIRETIADLKKTDGEPVDIAGIVLTKCNKVMRQTLFGGNGISEKEMRELNEHYFNSLMCMTSTNFLLVGTIAKYFIMPFSKGFKEGKKSHLLMRKMLVDIIKTHRKTFDENNIRDCIDAFFMEQKIRQSKNDPISKYFTDEVLMVSLTQIIGDGVLFMAIFIADFLKALLKYPEEQEKIYQELMEVVGTGRNPEMEDKSKLIYTNAFIMEVMRTSDAFTIFPSLECSKETTVCGYRIPKGAITVYNFYYAHYNPQDYEDPHRFNPSRFIAKEGVKKPDLLPLFGIGKRACMGEGFAMAQVFLFLTTIVKNFRLTKPVGEKEGSNLFYNFEKVNVCAHPRN